MEDSAFPAGLWQQLLSGLPVLMFYLSALLRLLVSLLRWRTHPALVLLAVAANAERYQVGWDCLFPSVPVELVMDLKDRIPSPAAGAAV
jgi:hypothetical protein